MDKFKKTCEDRIEFLLSYYMGKISGVSLEGIPADAERYREYSGAIQALIQFWFGHSERTEEYSWREIHRLRNILLEESRDE